MALRIDEQVVRGEIDNTVEGRTTGWIWLLGRVDPVPLELDGDCWRDLAGVRLRFTNPRPRPGLGLSGPQKGLVGDMTASRRARVPECSMEEFHARTQAGEEVPLVWKNCLYLEWFGEADGRVVIETTDYRLEMSDREWQMDADAEAAQKMANLQAMRDFLNRWIERRFPVDREVRIRNEEFEWEERLKESERVSQAYQEVLEKYMSEPDAEKKQAFVMGWDGLLESMATGDSPESLDAEEIEEAWKDRDDEEDSEGEDPFKEHPLQSEAQDLTMRAFDLMREEVETDPDATEVVNLSMQVACKLAGALSGTWEMEAGFVLAILKRCLVWQGEALAACGRLIEAETDPDKGRALEALRDGMFSLREEMVDLRRELKGS